jgi:hypothetical protein
LLPSVAASDARSYQNGEKDSGTTSAWTDGGESEVGELSLKMVGSGYAI